MRYRTAIHPAAQWVRDELFNRALADPDVKEVVFTAGGNGAGKTSMVLTGDVVMDSTLSNPQHSQRLIQSALDSGKRVHVVYTFRPIEEAFQGVLERAKTEGRAVPISTMIQTHEGAATTVSQLYAVYGDNPNVAFRFIDNSGPQPSIGNIALTWKQNYSASRGDLDAILESKRGEVGEAIYKATKSAGARGTGRPTRPTGNR
jgi:hypothetical protein